MAASQPLLEPAVYRYRFGDAEFDEARFELTLGGLPIELENKPLRVLATLLRQPGCIVSKADLKREVWDGRLTVEQVLTNAITKLRKALGDEGQRIITVPRQGYRITGPVQRVAMGARLLSRLRLAVGESVPNREIFILHSQLGATFGSEVWLARHHDTGEQRVFKFSIDGEHLGMLKREATIFRLLQENLGEREDFVRVIDWNFEFAPYHLECEYGGQSLAAWAGADRLASLSLSERLAILLQIAKAVAAAHSVGVLHRDLKPENVLIEARDDGSWRLRVADFGSGRLLDPSRLAELGMTATSFGLTRSVIDDSKTGTPLYLAPEILTGQSPTVRSDVYALGYMLYQIVVGDINKPMATGWERDIEDELLREDIAAATEGDPDRRLASVEELIDRLLKLNVRRAERNRSRDIERRALAAERELEKAKARRPWLIVAMASLIAGLVVSLWLFQQQRIARLQAQHETERAETINRFLNDDLLAATDPSGTDAGGNLRDVLAKAGARLAARFAQEPETEAALSLTIGNAYYGLSNYRAAETYQRRSLELFKSTRGERDTETLKASYQLAKTLELQTRNQEADALMAEADKNAGDRLNEKSDLALLAHWSHAGNWFMQMQPDKALKEYEITEGIRASLHPDSEAWLFRVHENLAWCYTRLGRAEDAVRALEPLLQSRYTPEDVGISDWIKSRLFYGFALVSMSRFDEAYHSMTDALNEAEAKLGHDHYMIAVILSYLSDAYQTAGDWPRAIDCAHRSYEISRDRLGEQAKISLVSLGIWGAVEYLGGHQQEGIHSMEVAHNALVSQRGANDKASQLVAFYLASAYHDIGRDTEALVLLSNCDPVTLGYVAPAKDWAERVQGLKGEILGAQGDYIDAFPLMQQAAEQLKKDGAPDWQIAPLRRSIALVGIAKRGGQ